MSAPTFSHRSIRPLQRTGSHCAARTGHRPAPRPASPGIGVGATAVPVPAIPAGRLSRYRVRADRPGLELEAGEIVLCTPYEPAALGMVVLVRCESDDYAPGALVPVWALEFLEHTDEHADPNEWSALGRRAERSSRTHLIYGTVRAASV